MPILEPPLVDTAGALASYRALPATTRAALDAYIAQAIEPAKRWTFVSRNEYEHLVPYLYVSATEWNGGLLAAGYQPRDSADVRYATSWKARTRKEATTATFHRGPTPAWMAEVQPLVDAAKQVLAIYAGVRDAYAREVSVHEYLGMAPQDRRLLDEWVAARVEPCDQYSGITPADYAAHTQREVTVAQLNGALLTHGCVLKWGLVASDTAGHFMARLRTGEATAHGMTGTTKRTIALSQSPTGQ